MLIIRIKNVIILHSFTALQENHNTKRKGKKVHDVPKEFSLISAQEKSFFFKIHHRENVIMKKKNTKKKKKMQDGRH